MKILYYFCEIKSVGAAAWRVPHLKTSQYDRKNHHSRCRFPGNAAYRTSSQGAQCVLRNLPLQQDAGNRPEHKGCDHFRQSMLRQRCQCPTNRPGRDQGQSSAAGNLLRRPVLGFQVRRKGRGFARKRVWKGNAEHRQWRVPSSERRVNAFAGMDVPRRHHLRHSGQCRGYRFYR